MQVLCTLRPRYPSNQLTDTSPKYLSLCATLCALRANSLSSKSVRGSKTRPRKNPSNFPIYCLTFQCNPVHFFGRNPHPFVLTFVHFGGTFRIHFPLSKKPRKNRHFFRNFVNFAPRKTSTTFPFRNPLEILLDCQTPRNTINRPIPFNFI